MKNQTIIFEDYSIDNKTVCIDETVAWHMVKQFVNCFPSENEEVLPGIKWGNYNQLYTPAFWKLQYVLSSFSDNINNHRLADTIIDEIVMCILGGYGIPSEMGVMAFNRLKEDNLINKHQNFDSLYSALSKPFINKNGKMVHYRFHNQKSKYIYKFLNRSDLDCIPQENDLELRSWLLTINGIGLKTASWITRNWLKSDNVAILDIHVLRAGILTGFFEKNITPSFDYLLLEKKYLQFCVAIQVLASNMDAIIWSYMKNNAILASDKLLLTS